MLLTVIDLETTGLNPEEDAVIEFAAILYSVNHREIISQVSCLMPCVINEAEETNGIKADASLAGLSHPLAYELVIDFAAQSHYAIAYQSDFDRQWLGHQDQSFILTELVDKTGNPIPWLDAMDFKWDKGTPGQSLVNTALANGIPVCSAHRALTDCQLVAALMAKHENLPELIRLAARPKNLFVACVDYNDRQLAKNAGFVWDKIVPGKWARWMVEEDTTMLPFKIAAVAQHSTVEP